MAWSAGLIARSGFLQRVVIDLAEEFTGGWGGSDVINGKAVRRIPDEAEVSVPTEITQYEVEGFPLPGRQIPVIKIEDLPRAMSGTIAIAVGKALLVIERLNERRDLQGYKLFAARFHGLVQPVR